MNEPGIGGPQIVWLSGRFLPIADAAVSPLDRGFMYGDGVFTTIRGDGGQPLLLSEHMERLRGSLAELQMGTDLNLDWRGIIRELLSRNGLSDAASIKIIVSRGIQPVLGMPQTDSPTIFIAAQRYYPPSPENYRTGWKLHVFRVGFAPPTARLKSLNYLYFLSAREEALSSGANEAVILDRSGQVAEASAGSLLVRTNGRWWVPDSPWQLPGITIGRVLSMLARKGIEVSRKSALPEELYRAETVWVLNSLMGIMPAAQVDGHTIPELAAEEADRIRKELLKLGQSSL